MLKEQIWTEHESKSFKRMEPHFLGFVEAQWLLRLGQDYHKIYHNFLIQHYMYIKQKAVIPKISYIYHF